MAPGGGGNIKVVVRVRPFNGRGMLMWCIETFFESIANHIPICL
jgi:hypothetical protein